MSSFTCVGSAPAIEAFALRKAFEEDTFPDKVELGIGAYRTDEGQPWVLPVVKETEKAMAEDDSLHHDYCKILGIESFTNAASRILLGEDNPVFKERKIVSAQALSGTGALRLGAVFLSRCLNLKDCYVSSPSSPNHPVIFHAAGFTNCRVYRYWKAADKNLDFTGMKEDLDNAVEGSVVILQVCAHNPTGVDPTQEQWKEIADIMERRKLLPFFDCTFLGFATGDIEKDSWPVRFFVSRGFEMLCAQSFSNNFGLYSERVGNLTLVVKDSSVVTNCNAQLSSLITGLYLTPPHYGARVVSLVLKDPVLFSKWTDHIKIMSVRIKQMREALKAKLDHLGTPGTWDHVVSQVGMFSFTGLSEDQVKFLVEQRHIYLPTSSRISICGLNSKNVDYVAEAMHEAVTTIPAN